MQYNKNYFTPLLLILLCSSAFAQNNGLNDADFNLVRDYEGTIEDADKLKLQLDVSPPEADDITHDYTMPQVKFNVDLPPPETRPTRVDLEALFQTQDNFLRFGFGSQLSALGELGFYEDLGKKKRSQLGIMGSHFSSNWGRLPNMTFMDSRVNSFLNYHSRYISMHIEGNFEHDIDHNYVYDTTQGEYMDEDVRQRATRYGGSVQVINHEANNLDITFNNTFGYNRYQDNWSNNENIINFDSRIGKEIDKFQHFEIITGFNYITRNANQPYGDLKRSVFKLGGHYHYRTNDWLLDATLGFGVGDVSPRKNKNQSKFDFFPKLEARREIIYNKLQFFARYDRDIDLISLDRLQRDNPWMILDSVDVQHAGYDHLTSGFQGGVKRFDYDIHFGMRATRNQALYRNFYDVNRQNLSEFQVVYDSLMITYNAHVDLCIKIKENVHLYFGADYFAYKVSNNEAAFNLPKLKTFTGVKMSVLDGKLLMRGELNIFAGAQGLDETGNLQTIPVPVDINLKSEYRFNKNFIIFAYLNNAFGFVENYQYQQFYNYPSYGVNVLVGATFQF